MFLSCRGIAVYLCAIKTKKGMKKAFRHKYIEPTIIP